MRLCRTVRRVLFVLTTAWGVLGLGAEANRSPARVGVFMWPESLCKVSPEGLLADTLAARGISDVFLLVKGGAGASVFPSEYTYADLYRELADKAEDAAEKQRYKRLSQAFSRRHLLSEFLQAAHDHGIRVHAWFIVSADRHFVTGHPGAEVVHLQHEPDKPFPYPLVDAPHVNLAYPRYKEYFLSLVKSALEEPFDGLMLDKIRYTHLVYSWDSIHLSRALRAGVPVVDLLRLASQTVYGGEDQKEAFIYKYRDGESGVRQWVDLRKQDVLAFVQAAEELAREKGVEFSADFMPEGAYDEDFADVYYAQNYHELSPHFDFVVVMAYAKDFRQPATWVKMVVENAKLRCRCPVWAAVQAYGGVSDSLVLEQVKNARLGEADGLATFRFGTMDSRSWKAFTAARRLELSKAARAQLKGVVFVGKGTIRNCWQKTLKALLLSESLIPICSKAPLFRDAEKLKSFSFIVLPGGGGSSEADALGVQGLHNTEAAVRSGVGYVGICAGAYLPIKGYFDNLTRELEIVNAEAVDIDHWNRGSGKVTLEIVRDHPIFADVGTDTLSLQYYSGPVLRRDSLDLPDYRELAVFLSDLHENGAQPGEMLGKTAILEARFGQGRIILFSPHPELTPGREGLLTRAVLYVSRSDDGQ